MIKKIIPFILVAVIVGGGAFFGGMKYGESKKSFGKNFTPGQFNGGFQNGAMVRNGNGQGGGFVNGEIISKDEKNMTVKLRDGGSKIIFFADTTEISKFASGSSSDLEVGKSVMVTGKTNQDGSVTAQTIQIRPENSAVQGMPINGQQPSPIK